MATVFACSSCSLVSGTEVEAKEHFYEVHETRGERSFQPRQVSVLKLEYSCVVCHFTSSNKAVVIAHMRKSHRLRDAQEVDRAEDKPEKERGQKNTAIARPKDMKLMNAEDYMQTKEVDCAICDFRSHSLGVLDVHKQKLHQQTLMPSCSNCKLIFRDATSLTTHWRTAHAFFTKMMGCDICDVFKIVNCFKSKVELAIHTKKIHGPDRSMVNEGLRSFTCPLCHKGSAFRKRALEHLESAHADHFMDIIGVKNPAIRGKIARDLMYRCHHKDCEVAFDTKKGILKHAESVHDDRSGRLQPRPGSPAASFTSTSIPLNEYLKISASN